MFHSFIDHMTSIEHSFHYIFRDFDKSRSVTIFFENETKKNESKEEEEEEEEEEETKKKKSCRTQSNTNQNKMKNMTCEGIDNDVKQFVSTFFFPPRCIY
jgi:hypothetical protein